jgi:anthranilate/para-aminobenzoate synthase component I
VLPLASTRLKTKFEILQKLVVDTVVAESKVDGVAAGIIFESRAEWMQNFRETMRLLKIQNIVKKLEAPAPALKKLEIKNSFNPMLIKSNQNKAQYMDMVKDAKEFIKAGDIFQVVLSQRFEMELKDEPFELYRKLRQSNPAPSKLLSRSPGVSWIIPSVRPGDGASRL